MEANLIEGASIPTPGWTGTKLCDVKAAATSNFGIGTCERVYA
jgi:hypothetical protein